MATKTNINEPVLILEKNNDLVKDSSIIKFYANSFQCGLTLGDGSIVFRQDDVSLALVHMSIPAMKALVDKLNEILVKYQEDIDVEILGLEDIAKKIKIK